MIQGTKSVRTALGAEFDNVSDHAIQEALWHYYYDVDKSVVYLKSACSNHSIEPSLSIEDQRTPRQQQQPKKQKQESPFDKAASSAAQKPVTAKSGRSRSLFNDIHHDTMLEYTALRGGLEGTVPLGA